MRVLITGASGFVGRHLVKYIKDNTKWTLVKQNPDYIINLASNSSVEQSIKDPASLIENNIYSLIEVLEQCRITKPKIFIHMSTVEAVRPTNPYAASKAAQEAICIAYRETYNIPVIIARSHNIIGEGQSPEKFVPKLIERIKAGETIDIYGRGSRVYNPVENVVSALLFLIKHHEVGKTYLIGGGERLTNLEMARKVAEQLDLPLKYNIVRGRAGYARALRGEGNRIMGWTPPLTLERGLSWIK